MSFHEVRIAPEVSVGARRSIRRSTQVAERASGDEDRNAQWENSLRAYDIGFAVREVATVEADVVAFFEARRGRAYGFRFSDPHDCRSAAYGEAIAATDQIIGAGDGLTVLFQLVKTYASGNQSYRRPIRKPVRGTVSVAVDGVPVDALFVDHSAGLVLFAEAPTEGAAITAGFEFDVPVRFDQDSLDSVLESDVISAVPSLPLVELRKSVPASDDEAALANFGEADPWLPITQALAGSV